MDICSTEFIRQQHSKLSQTRQPNLTGNPTRLIRLYDGNGRVPFFLKFYRCVSLCADQSLPT